MPRVAATGGDSELAFVVVPGSDLDHQWMASIGSCWFSGNYSALPQLVLL